MPLIFIKKDDDKISKKIQSESREIFLDSEANLFGAIEMEVENFIENKNILPNLLLIDSDIWYKAIKSTSINYNDNKFGIPIGHKENPNLVETFNSVSSTLMVKKIKGSNKLEVGYIQL